MARINLLPWRAELRERKNKEFITVLVASLLLGLAAAFAVWYFFNNTLNEYDLANEHIAAENQKLDDKLVEIETLEKRRDEIISRMRVIQDLQGKRPLPVRVWDDVAKAIPNTMYLNIFQRKGDTLTFTGKADNPNVVSKLVRNLDASDWLADSKVKFIKQNVNAYESPAAANKRDNEDRPVYPEDSYIEFVVTTQMLTVEQSKQVLADTAVSEPKILVEPEVADELEVDTVVESQPETTVETEEVVVESEPEAAEPESKVAVESQADIVTVEPKTNAGDE